MAALFVFILALAFLAILTCFWAGVIYLAWNLILVPLIGIAPLSFGLSVVLLFVLMLLTNLVLSKA